ncbi:LOW QUALITY PROTEIN: hypothetical protein Cgig2_030064 [Carnegiea gigantea]|uniref:DUF4283 domain-containing protein n=1 Tax=Carnegiea gigantea TaxID=171969 RepID=A0A9Q1JEB2_9CARY|nr:LOW QUALITY PROTEIN: hypothetical protein Cgig2_030064 [Carnegiea gigantea]
MDINTKTLVSLPIWVRFLELDIKHWGLDSLSKIGSVLGIPIKTDKYIRDKYFLRYARLLIEMQLQDNFQEFVNEHNVVVRQKVEYEWKPTKCSFCKIQEPQNLAPPQPHTDEEGFVTIRKKAATLVTGHKELYAPTHVQNCFNSLTETEGPENMHLKTEGRGPPMDRIYSWNIRGLYWPNKQEDVKIILHEKHMGFIRLLEIKFIHCKATQTNTMKSFYITFVYGANQEMQRRILREDLKHIAKNMDDA